MTRSISLPFEPNAELSVRYLNTGAAMWSNKPLFDLSTSSSIRNRDQKSTAQLLAVRYNISRRVALQYIKSLLNGEEVAPGRSVAPIAPDLGRRGIPTRPLTPIH